MIAMATAIATPAVEKIKSNTLPPIRVSEEAGWTQIVRLATFTNLKGRTEVGLDLNPT